MLPEIRASATSHAAAAAKQRGERVPGAGEGLDGARGGGGGFGANQSQMGGAGAGDGTYDGGGAYGGGGAESSGAELYDDHDADERSAAALYDDHDAAAESAIVAMKLCVVIKGGVRSVIGWRSGI